MEGKKLDRREIIGLAAGAAALGASAAPISQAGAATVYVYMTSWETPASGGIFKTPHTMEIPFMLYNFDRVRAFVGPGPEPKHMADQIAGAWVAFARTGRPDHAGIPHWPAFNAATRPVMDFNLTSRVVNDPLPGVRMALSGMTAPPPRG